MSRVIAQKVTPADTGITELYRAPERTEAVIDQVLVSNADGSTRSFTIYHGSDGVEIADIAASDIIGNGDVNGNDVGTAIDETSSVKLA